MAKVNVAEIVGKLEQLDQERLEAVARIVERSLKVQQMGVSPDEYLRAHGI